MYYYFKYTYKEDERKIAHNICTNDWLNCVFMHLLEIAKHFNMYYKKLEKDTWNACLDKAIYYSRHVFEICIVIHLCYGAIVFWIPTIISKFQILIVFVFLLLEEEETKFYNGICINDKITLDFSKYKGNHEAKAFGAWIQNQCLTTVAW